MISTSCFEECYNLTCITIPESVSTISSSAFRRCYSLEYVFYGGSKSQWTRVTGAEATPLSGAKVIFDAKEFGTITSFEEDEKTFKTIAVGASAGDVIILALYNGDKFVGMEKAVYMGSDVSFAVDDEFTMSKIMVWKTLSNMEPVLHAETIMK